MPNFYYILSERQGGGNKMANKLKAVIGVLTGKYAVIQKNGVTLIVETNMDKKNLKEAACLFFREVYALQH